MNRIADHGWMIVARSLASFAFAAVLLLAPGWSSLRMLAVAFGIWAFVDGAGSLAFVVRVRGVQVATYLARGGLGLALGALTLALSHASTPHLYMLVGAWAVGTGALEIAFGSRAWSDVPQALGFMVIGAQSLAFGLSVVDIPLESVAVLRGLLASFALANGIAAHVIGWRLSAPQPTRPSLATS
jgi:uncharacterized membrane protein HdeD (DUF308 family)